MKKVFSQEELALMGCYEVENLHELQEALQLALPHLEDKPAADSMADCIDALCRMEEKDYPALRAEIAACQLI